MRHADWKQRLIGFLAEAAHKPFAPGEHDCALFAAGAVAAMTGEDHGLAFKGRYTTLEAGLKLLRKAGFCDHAELAASLFPEIAPAFAAPGDLAVIDLPEGSAMGVVQGESIFVLTPERMGLVPLMTASRAFRVA